jgi:HSP20 family protein
MNLIRKQRTFFPSLIDDYVNQDGSFNIPTSNSMPAVNIKELDNQFEIDLAVPGKKKSDFEIEVEDGQLSISSSIEEKEINEKAKITRREFSYDTFKRTFSIPDSVDLTKVEAKYLDGVLQLRLIKRKEALPQPKKLVKVL